MLCSVHSLPRCLDLDSVSCLIFRSEVDPLGQRKACFDIVIPMRKLCMCQYTQDQDVEVVVWILALPRKALCLGSRVLLALMLCSRGKETCDYFFLMNLFFLDCAGSLLLLAGSV